MIVKRIHLLFCCLVLYAYNSLALQIVQSIVYNVQHKIFDIYLTKITGYSVRSNISKYKVIPMVIQFSFKAVLIRVKINKRRFCRQVETQFSASHGRSHR